ncbi:MAG: hypothetical protein JWO37_2701 [Acidimicrobiales bacterium]|jgi:hypothetical protein|nr:hypothetical protein [Acidimicrobiales bacterium]
MARRLGVLLAGLALAACRPDTVRLAYRPRAGDHARYRVIVRTATTRVVAGIAPDVTDDTATLVADQTVLAVANGEARVRVVLSRPGSPDRTFVVRFDRGGQLVAVDSIEGLPTSALGRLGLPEVFPAAPIAPDTPLRPGQRWRLGPSTGRLVELGIEHGRRVARMTARTALPATASAPTADGGTVELRGTEITDATSTRQLGRGDVERSTSVTTANFALRIVPPPGQAGPPLDGTLAVTVRADVTRLA